MREEIDEVFTAYVTKYALTQGILTVNAQLCERSSTEMIEVVGSRSGGVSQYFHGKGKDWHTSMADAIAKANEMRLKKIESMKKQIEKLESMRFE